MLKATFLKLLHFYSSDVALNNKLWHDVENKYSDKKRHYHTLQHLENLLNELIAVKSEIQNWETILFTLFYHDIIYNSLKSDNEQKSADYAEQKMQTLSVPIEIIRNCKKQILATQSHVFSIDNDTNLFTDADLSVLGYSHETYTEYYQNIRREYNIYPDLVYNPGRKKVLLHFLNMDKIYKTPYFYNKYELQARNNLAQEIKLLNG